MFEIHITTSNIQQNAIPDFIDFCAFINAKPIIIELEEGIVQQQPMISKVVKDTSLENLHNTIDKLVGKFEDANYEVKRLKIEVPLEYTRQGILAFPEYRGKYYEWHGKVKFTNLASLKEALKFETVHLSNNSLKGEPNQRFLTIRTYGSEGQFMYSVKQLKNSLNNRGYKLIKEEYEFCIFDSNKKIDSGWIETPEFTDNNYLRLLAFEGFLRRASKCSNGFILKGSLVTRQYIEDKSIRDVGDLDFVYKFPIGNDDDAEKLFSEWLTQVTETELEDNIKYRSFKENKFWRGIDYAMNDDFPTTNTDLFCRVKGQVVSVVPIDISWNLPFDEEPVSFMYYPQEGEPFIIQNTVPLSLQISWKLHQCVVRPRAKDLLDVILLLENNKLDNSQLKLIVSHFVSECKSDKISPNRVMHYLNGEVSTFYKENQAEIDDFDFSEIMQTKFGLELTFSFGLKNLQAFNNAYLKYETMLELILDFEESLREMGIQKFLSKSV